MTRKITTNDATSVNILRLDLVSKTYRKPKKWPFKENEGNRKTNSWKKHTSKKCCKGNRIKCHLRAYHLKTIHSSWQHSPWWIHIIALDHSMLDQDNKKQGKPNNEIRFMAAVDVPFCPAYDYDCPPPHLYHLTAVEKTCIIICLEILKHTNRETWKQDKRKYV